MRIKTGIFLLVALISGSKSFAGHRSVDLVIGYRTVHFSRQTATAITANQQIPAPILHFREGDRITLNVYNRLNQETAIHWHGLLVPWQMDGVLGISQQGIPPGGVYHYHFTLNQSGTYWYHAHAGLQEQQGLYGAFIVDPRTPPRYKYTKDYVVVLSDWSNTAPDKILANLKKQGDYYSPRMPLQASLAKFIHDYRKSSAEGRLQLLDDYKMMQQMRMGLYDISDVSYDTFLLNGKSLPSPWTAPAKVGDIVRLRFIGAGGSTLFHVKIPNTRLQVIQVQGNDVQPYFVEAFTIAPGETWDVLVHIQKKDPYIIYAESIDTSGAAYGALTTAPHQTVHYREVTPFPEPVPSTRNMMSMMMAGMHSAAAHQSMKPHPVTHSHEHHMGMSMPTTVTASTVPPSGETHPASSKTKYQNLTAAVKTNDPNKPVFKVIDMELSGYMDKYIWMINGLPEHDARPVVLEPGKRYRFIFKNVSMMHHPMHIHGHWFILREGKGAYDPLLHTIDVPPGATLTADIDTEASGQWMFHCHLLYHMVSGMSRVFQYSTLLEITEGTARPENTIQKTPFHNRPIVRVDEAHPLDAALVNHPMAHPVGLWLATFLDLGEDPFHNAQRFTYKGLYGPDYNKLQLFINDAERSEGNIENADIDIFYWHLISQFWAVKGGLNYFYRPTTTPYWQPGIGIEGLMPWFIDTNIRGYYYSGSARLDVELSRDTQLLNNLFLRAGIRSILATRSVANAAIGSGLNQMRLVLRPYYRLMPGVNVYVEYEHEQDYGPFRQFQSAVGDSGVQNTLSLGLAMLF